jgi:hypothetical protein
MLSNKRKQKLQKNHIADKDLIDFAAAVNYYRENTLSYYQVKGGWSNERPGTFPDCNQ